MQTTLGELTRNQRRIIKRPLEQGVAMITFNKESFPVRISFGQIINPKKAYKRWKLSGGCGIIR